MHTRKREEKSLSVWRKALELQEKVSPQTLIQAYDGNLLETPHIGVPGSLDPMRQRYGACFVGSEGHNKVVLRYGTLVMLVSVDGLPGGGDYVYGLSIADTPVTPLCGPSIWGEQSV